MLITVKSRTNVFIMLTTNIRWIISKKMFILSKKIWLILHIFCHVIQQNINKKITHFCHVNLEKFVYKMVAW